MSNMTGPQCRAARELLGMTQRQLCEACDLSVPTVRNIEREAGDPKVSSFKTIEEFFRGRGIHFVERSGMIGLSPKEKPSWLVAL